MLRFMAILLAVVAVLPQSHSSMNARLDGTGDPSSAHARPPSPRTLEPTDARTLSRLQLREELFRSLHVTEEARAHLAGLEQVSRRNRVYDTRVYKRVSVSSVAQSQALISLSSR